MGESEIESFAIELGEREDRIKTNLYIPKFTNDTVVSLFDVNGVNASLVFSRQELLRLFLAMLF